jgi:Membrane-bound metallopeptidase
MLFMCLLALFLPCAAASQGSYHVLAKGETLYSVARSYGISVDELAKANSITDPSRVKLGMKLLIPGQSGDGSATLSDDASSSAAASGSAASASSAATPTIHKVAKGETLFSIARSYGITVDELRAANKLGPSSIIKVGDKLTIPSDDTVAAAVSPKASAQATGSVAAQQGAASPKASQPAKSTSAPSSPSPAVPDAVKTSVKPVSKGLSWPCPGDILYLDGKAYGVVIKAREGTVEKAVAAGTVSSAGPYRGYGNVVFVLSRSGYIYVYGGNDSLLVRAGDKVRAGQEIGKVGMDAKQGFPAAYFLVFKNGEALDPAQAPRD